MLPALADVQPEIASLCRQFHVRRLDLFGSAARETDFGPESDIDLLVEYDPDHSPPALADFFALRDDLQALLGRPVDLAMAGAIRNPYVQAEIDRSRRTLHAA